MRKWVRPAGVFAALLVAVSCGNNDTTAGGASSGASIDCRSDIKVGLALDVGGLGDNGFNDLANAGMNKAVADGVVCQANAKLLESNSEGTNLDENVLSLAEAGYDLIIGTGYAFSDDGKVNEYAPDYPEVDFAVVDGFATCGTECGLPNDADAIPNVVDLTFKEQEGSFLMGVAAALKAQELNCDTVGFLGGQTGYVIGKFEAGYRAGVQEIDPGITVLVEYIGHTTQAYFDPIQGEALSNAMYDRGACIIYHAAGDSGNGLFKAAAAQQKLAIGADADQHEIVTPEQAPFIMTSMIKRVDTATYDTIKAVADGTFEGGKALVFDLADKGISYATSNPDEMGPEIVSAVKDYAAKIIAGDIVPPEKPEQV
jgi:basic membrane protein A and related proteins